MPDFLAATYALRPRNDLARSALPGAPVKARRQRGATALVARFTGVVIRRTVKPAG
ncbi:hypothetical protein [Nonomuraea phyllanthi]|uniref:hypothetical protein n=1 Tax=Nonomuraea phyllanthi TaxID=2219224 RepID=UPI001292FB25|nr:hypothetical protein [Nonomuraea phyllanthi]